MALAKKPKSNQTLSDSKQITAEQEAFISGAPDDTVRERTAPRKTRPVMLRVPEDLLERIDQRAQKQGIKRAAFIVSAASKELDRLDRPEAN